MNKFFFALALLFACFTCSTAQSLSGYHTQKFKLAAGSNNLRLDLNKGTLQVVVRDAKVISATHVNPAGRKKQLKIAPTSTRFSNCDCPNISEFRFLGSDGDFGYLCTDDCGSSPNPGDPGKPEMPELFIAWCTTDCPDNW